MSLSSEISPKIAVRTIYSFKVAILFLRERSRSKRVRERARLELTTAVESAPARALLNWPRPTCDTVVVWRTGLNSVRRMLRNCRSTGYMLPT